MKILFLISIFTISLLSQTKSVDNELPSSTIEVEKFTPLQDSAFIRAMKSNLPTEFLIKESLDIIEYNMQMNRIIQDSPWMIARRNLASIPREYFEADPVEVVQRQTMIQDAQYVPFVQTIPRNAFVMDLVDIGKLLGIVEDTSPTLKYTIDYASDVQIVIYSVNAKVVATIFSGMQTPGNYKRTWNGRDDNGKMLPKGDYIGEVRIGEYKYIRKVIELKY
jgi:hypothetical protein